MNLQVVIIDEVTMVGSETLLMIHRRLHEIRGNNKPFGGISILAIGDLHQLPPVCQSHVFQSPRTGIDLFCGSLWEEHFKVLMLKEIMWQKDDQNKFAELLSRVREGQQTEEDVTLLQTRVVTPWQNNYPTNVLHVFATKKEVSKHNNSMLNALGNEIKIIPARDVKPDSLHNYTPKDDERYTGGLQTSLSLAIGAHVMLIRNLDVADGLVNGSQGVVVGFDEATGSVTKIFVKFYHELIGQKSRQQMPAEPGEVTIMPFESKFRVSKYGKEEIKRYQFPLQLAWAVMIHQVQGLTTKNTVVSLNKTFQSGQAYVALSCATSLSGLHLLDLEPKKIYHNKKVATEMKRMLPSMSLMAESTETSNQAQTKFALLNVRSLKRHFLDIVNDPALRGADTSFY